MSVLEEIVLGALFYGGLALLLVAAFRVSTTVGLALLGVVLMVSAVLAAGGRSNV